MKSKDFSPKQFIDEFKRETGLTEIDIDEARSFIEDSNSSWNDKYFKNPVKLQAFNCVAKAYEFAIAIADQSKLNQCLRHAKHLAENCPEEEKCKERLKAIFNQITTTRDLFVTGKQNKDSAKSFRKSKLKTYENSEARYLKKIRHAIETLTHLEPDLLRFDELYCLKLAKEKFIDDCLSQPECPEYYGALRKRRPIDNVNPKFDIHIQHFVWDTHDLLKRYNTTLTDNAICTRLASLLTLITGNENSRQNVQNFLKRKP